MVARVPVASGNFSVEYPQVLKEDGVGVAGIVILGMHRGGTSALARVVNLLGPEVGETADLMAAADENRRGFWELASLSEFNEELLLHLGGRWSGPPAIDTSHLRNMAAGPWGHRAAALFADLLPVDGWVWKDPRLCLLLPFWSEVLDVEFVTVHAVRAPGDVAASLEERNGFLERYSLALWERHHRSALEATGDLPGYVVGFEDLLADPESTVVGLRDWLAAAGADVLGDDAVPVALRSLSSSDRHHHDRRGVELTTEQRDLLGLLGSSGALDNQPPGPETSGLQLAFDEHHHLAGVRDLADQLQAGMNELQEAAVSDRAAAEERLVASRDDAATAWAAVRRLQIELTDAIEGRIAVVEALEGVIEERDGWKWTALQYENRTAARLRRRARRLVVGEEP